MPPRVRLVAGGPGLDAEQLTGLVTRARDARPATKSILHHLLVAEREQFATSGARGGKPWPENSPGWQETKSAEGKSTKPNRYTDELFHSLTDEKNKDGVRSATKLRAALGTKKYYAVFLAAQRTLVFTKADVNIQRDIFVRWLLDGEVR